MPEIIVNHLTDITVDGQPNTSVADVLTNYAKVEGIRGAVQAALEIWYATRKQANADSLQALRDTHAGELKQAAESHEAALTAALKEQADRHKAAIGELQAKHSSAISSLTATITDQKAQIEALGGTELGKELARKAKCQTLREQRAKIEAELAALDRDGEVP